MLIHINVVCRLGTAPAAAKMKVFMRFARNFRVLYIFHAINKIYATLLSKIFLIALELFPFWTRTFFFCLFDVKELRLIMVGLLARGY